MTSAALHLKVYNIGEDFFRKTRREEGEYPLRYLTDEQRILTEKRPQRCKVLDVTGYLGLISCRRE